MTYQRILTVTVAALLVGLSAAAYAGDRDGDRSQRSARKSHRHHDKADRTHHERLWHAVREARDNPEARDKLADRIDKSDLPKGVKKRALRMLQEGRDGDDRAMRDGKGRKSKSGEARRRGKGNRAERAERDGRRDRPQARGEDDDDRPQQYAQMRERMERFRRAFEAAKEDPDKARRLAEHIRRSPMPEPIKHKVLAKLHSMHHGRDERGGNRRSSHARREGRHGPPHAMHGRHGDDMLNYPHRRWHDDDDRDDSPPPWARRGDDRRPGRCPHCGWHNRRDKDGPRYRYDREGRGMHAQPRRQGRGDRDRAWDDRPRDLAPEQIEQIEHRIHELQRELEDMKQRLHR